MGHTPRTTDFLHARADHRGRYTLQIQPLPAYIGKHACLNVIMAAMPECAIELKKRSVIHSRAHAK
jgi:hypothetical protein